MYMNITSILFITLLIAWFVEWFIFQESTGKEKEVHNRALLLKGIVAITVLFSIIVSVLLRNVIGQQMSFSSIIGLFLLAQGIVLRYWTYFLIKPYFSRSISNNDVRPLFSHGPFRFSRHPLHSGLFLITLGIGLFLSGHWMSILCTFLLLGSALHYTMIMEESIFKEKYGDIYTYWCRHRYRLVPFLY
ncbi:methyltransferase family protein [Evansella cellulosilytica]|nr:methyltransferase [Evansella cellulosilytica]